MEQNFPIGHHKRREEGMPVLVKKFEASVDAHFSQKQAERIRSLFASGTARLDALPAGLKQRSDARRAAADDHQGHLRRCGRARYHRRPFPLTCR